MVNQRAGVLGTGHSYPEGILTNAELANIVETSDEWITTRTGIKQRRKAAPDEYTSLFAVRAARRPIAGAPSRRSSRPTRTSRLRRVPGRPARFTSARPITCVAPARPQFAGVAPCVAPDRDVFRRRSAS